MNRVILGEASIMCSRGFGEEKKKKEKKPKKNPLHFSLCMKMRAVTMIILDRGLHTILFLLMVFPLQ